MLAKSVVPKAFCTSVPTKIPTFTNHTSVSKRSILKRANSPARATPKTVTFAEQVQTIHPVNELSTESSTGPNLSSIDILKTLKSKLYCFKSTALPNTTITAALDSGASYPFLQDTFNGTNHDDTKQGLPVETACGAIIRSNSTDTLPLPQIPANARKCHKFAPADLNMPLLSVKQFCDSDLTVVFNKNKVQVIKPTTLNMEVPGDTLIEGKVDPLTQLYMVNLPTNTDPITAPGGGTHASTERELTKQI